MYKTKLNKIGNFVEKIKDDINLPIISDFLEWFLQKLEMNFGKTYSNFIPSKGEVYFVNLGRNIGSELNKTRPCIICSDYFMNNGDTVLIIPLKSYKGKINKNINIFISTDNLKGLTKDSILDIMGIRQISKKRIGKLIGKLDKITLIKIDNKLKKIFNIKNRD